MSATPKTVPGMHSEGEQAKQKPEATCAMPSCGKTFQRERAWARFCSVKCRNDYHHSMAPEALRRDIEALRAQVAALATRVTALDDPTAKP